MWTMTRFTFFVTGGGTELSLLISSTSSYRRRRRPWCRRGQRPFRSELHQANLTMEQILLCLLLSLLRLPLGLLRSLLCALLSQLCPLPIQMGSIYLLIADEELRSQHARPVEIFLRAAVFTV